jgi:hypothetical protein
VSGSRYQIRGWRRGLDAHFTALRVVLVISGYSMSQVINVSDNLGKLLLEGWVCEQNRAKFSPFDAFSWFSKVPSDRTCQAEGCRGIPLLRSPEGRDPVTWFCPSCEGDGSGKSPPFIRACLTLV